MPAIVEPGGKTWTRSPSPNDISTPGTPATRRRSPHVRARRHVQPIPTCRRSSIPQARGVRRRAVRVVPGPPLRPASTELTPPGRSRRSGLCWGRTRSRSAGCPRPGGVSAAGRRLHPRRGRAASSRVEGYFDAGTLVRQLGLDVIVQPSPSARSASGRARTWQQGHEARRDQHDRARGPERRGEGAGPRCSRGKSPRSMLGMPGFIGWVGAVIGRGCTRSRRGRTPEAHGAAARRRHAQRRRCRPSSARSFAAGAQTGVWAPEHLNGVWVRCPAAARWSGRPRRTQCRCGAELPASPRWW